MTVQTARWVTATASAGRPVANRRREADAPGKRDGYSREMGKLFISHAVHDKSLVEAVIKLLEGGVGVSHRDIFCSSLKGQSIKAGEAFVDSIRESLDEAKCVLALISEAYYASAFCMCELGGVWLASKSFLPVLVPPLEYKDLKAVLAGLQVSKIGSEADMDELRDELIERLEPKAPHGTARWTSRRDEFLGALPELQKSIQFKGAVTREKFEKLEKELRSYKDEYKALEGNVAGRDRLIADLKAAKDAKAVTKIVRQHSSTAETFHSLVEVAATALAPLDHAVQQALYYRERGEDFRPGRDGWDNVRDAIEYGQVELTDEGTAVTPNKKNPKVRKALDALNALSGWLEEPPEDFHDWYAQENGGEEPKISQRGFWDRHLV